MIGFKHKGNFKMTETALSSMYYFIRHMDLDQYGKAGVEALSAATPIDTGLASRSWYYEIEKTDKSVILRFCNSDIENDVPIAIILQYGHATKNGGWVEGRDYINPAVRPIFDKIALDAWREVTGR